jgi:CubicO group peptidase (beta-lactamase class C family)
MENQKIHRRLASSVSLLAVAPLVVLTLSGCGLRNAAARFDAQQARDDAIRDILKRRIDAKQSVGIVVGVTTRGTSQFISYGSFNGPGTPPVNEDTVFEIGSITKAFTTTVLADMVTRGEAALDAQVDQYLPPEVRLPSTNGKAITLLDLATHTSGLPRLPANLDPADNANPFADYTQEHLYMFLSSYVLPRDPGELYEYSNLGMALLGHALARRAGLSYETLVVDRVLEPLKMHDTRISLTPALQVRFTPGHDVSLAPQKPWELPALAGSGAFRSTARDLLTFLAAYSRSAGTPIGELVSLALEPRRSAGNPLVSVGLGWHIVEQKGERIGVANGQTGGYAAFAAFSTSSGTSVVVLSNSSRSIDDIGWHVIDPSMPVYTSLPATPTETVLEPSGLDRFVGEYRLSATDVIAITRRDDALWARVAELNYQLFAEGPQKFFMKAVDAQIAFVIDASGDVTGLTLRYGKTDFTAQKVR